MSTDNLIDRVLRENESVCLDSPEDRERLAKALTEAFENRATELVLRELAERRGKRTELGWALPNGAILLARRTVARGHEIVLALRPRGEYITWRVYHQDDNTTSEGHYFEGFIEAAEDYRKRK